MRKGSASVSIETMGSDVEVVGEVKSVVDIVRQCGKGFEKGGGGE